MKILEIKWSDKYTDLMSNIKTVMKLNEINQFKRLVSGFFMDCKFFIYRNTL